jgi:hypothetical protein
MSAGSTGHRGPKPHSKGDGKGRDKQKSSDAPLDQQTLEYYAYQAAQQMYVNCYAHLFALLMGTECSEYLFSDENLAMDTYLRSYMDEAGWVPLNVIFSYPNVAYFNVSHQDLMTALKTALAQPTTRLELDENFDTIKLKEKCEMVSEHENERWRALKSFVILQWVMPNQNGGRGLPLYSSQPRIESLASPGTVTASATPTNPAGTGRRSRSGTEELSASAPEFKPAVKPDESS